MPTYEYECKSCSHNFEVFQSMSDPPLKDCPECGKEIRRLIFGGTGVIFKGSGFYVTDKSKGPAKTETKSSSQGTDGAAKSETGAKQDSGGESSKERPAEKSSTERSSSERSSAGPSEKSKSETKSA